MYSNMDEFENIMPSEKSQIQKNTLYDSIHMRCPGKSWIFCLWTDQFIEVESRLVVVRGWGMGGLGSDCLTGFGFSFWSDENVLELDSGNGCTTL